MSILTHADWRLLAPFLKIEYVGRDPRRGAEAPPRYRIEVTAVGTPGERLREIASPCVACGAPMSPVRQRTTGALYFAATCADGLHGACSKGTAARQEYRAVHDALAGVVPYREPGLFDGPLWP